MSIYIVNGAPGSGKTTFEEFVRTFLRGEVCHIFSTVDFVKRIALFCGWDRTKTPQNRKFLSDLKDLLTKWDDVPFKKTIEDVENFQKLSANPLIFIDCREPEEIDRLVKYFNAKSILISRAAAENAGASNHADKNILEYEYDYVINNNGSLGDLMETATSFILSQGYLVKDFDFNLFKTLVYPQ